MLLVSHMFDGVPTQRSMLTMVAGNFTNVGIWAELEPTMAVVCSCIPSLRPLFEITRQAFRNSRPPRQKKMSWRGGAPSSKRTWSSSKSKGGGFSHLDEQSEDSRPLGHVVSVCGGTISGLEPEIEAPEIPSRGIQVQREVRITSTKLEYKDRLF